MYGEGRFQMASIHRTPPSLPKRASDGENGTPQSSLQPQPKQLRHHTAAPPQPQPQPQPRPQPQPQLQLGVPFPVETELFEGHALLRTRSTPGCEEYFAGKARRTSFVVLP